jgi:hypothetical protein
LANLSAFEIFHKVSNFLFSRANREFLIFLFFFFVAGIFWLMMALNETYEKDVRIPVFYTDIDKNAVLTSSDVDTIVYTVRDKGYMLATYLYGETLHPIGVDFRKYARNGKGVVPTSELLKMVSGRFKASSKIVSVKPEGLVFYYNKGEKKKVPVKWRGTVTPDALYFISNVVYEPDSITVLASGSKLDSLNVVYTEPLHQTNFRDTLTVNSRLQKLSGVKMVPDNVKVRFMTDILTEVSIDDIPVVGINMPEGMVLRTFPAKVSVRFVAGAKTYSALSASDFVVVADYKEFGSNPSPQCNIYLQKVPNGISKAKLEVARVDYLIEEQNR